jgi:hypothetical protein
METLNYAYLFGLSITDATITKNEFQISQCERNYPLLLKTKKIIEGLGLQPRVFLWEKSGIKKIKGKFCNIQNQFRLYFTDEEIIKNIKGIENKFIKNLLSLEEKKQVITGFYECNGNFKIRKDNKRIRIYHRKDSGNLRVIQRILEENFGFKTTFYRRYCGDYIDILGGKGEIERFFQVFNPCIKNFEIGWTK